MTSLLHDLRLAVTALWRAPGSAIPAIATLAVGTSGTVAVVSLLYAVVLRPLPVERPHELVSITAHNEQGQPLDFPVPFLPELSKLTDVFESASVTLSSSPVTAEVGGALSLAVVDSVSADYFRTLDIAPLAGRLIDASDLADTPAAAQVVVLGYRFWQRHYIGDSTVVGQNVRIENLSFRVIGIAPPQYFGLRVELATDLTIPIGAYLRLQGVTLGPGQMMVGTAAVARLHAGVEIDQAAGRVDTLWSEIARMALPPAMDRARQDSLLKGSATVEDLSVGLSYLRDRYSRVLISVLMLCAWMLLVACVTVAGLITVQATARDHERATRIALGASRSQLARGVLFESVILAGTGVALGMPLALLAAPRLVQLLALNFWVPTTLEVAPDWQVFGVTALIGLGIGVMVGGLAAWRATRLTVESVLRTARAPTTDAGGWIHRLLVVQTAMSVVLIVGAVALASHLWLIRHVNPGFVSQGVTRLLLWPQPGAAAATPEDLRAIQEAITTLPHVVSAAFVNGDVGEGADANSGYPVGPIFDTGPGTGLQAHVDAVSPGYVETLRVRLVAGRDLTWQDSATRPRVALVTESLAARLFPGETALGRRIVIRATERPMDFEIVGILADPRLRDVRQAAPLHVLVPQAQIGPAREPRLLVRLRRGVPAAGPAVAEVVRTGRHYVVHEQSLDTQIDHQLTRERLLASFAGFFGVFAATLVVVGLYGLLSFIVTSHTREIGVRMAIGASPVRVRAMVVWQSLRVILLGAVVGLPAARAASNWLSWMMPDMAPPAPAAAGVVMLLLIALGLGGAYLPARRASRVDPMSALRAE